MKLRPYQQQAIDGVMDAFDRNVRSGIVCLFTGGGKSLTAIELSKAFRAKHGGKTLFLVDQIDLGYQAFEAFTAQFPDARIGLEMNDHRAKPTDDIVIACVATIGRKGSMRIGKFSPDEFSLVIADEAHKSLSDIWLRVFHYLGVHPENFQKGKMLVGLTATPRRTGGGLGAVYDDFFANHDIVFGIRQGWLVPIEWIRVQTNVDIDGIGAGEDFNLAELEEAINLEARNKLIVKSYLDNGGGKALVYCAGVKHAYEVREEFIRAGIRAEVIEANTDKAKRKQWLDEYKNGHLDVLTNYGTLTTGVDAPETGMLILGRPVKSSVLYQQIIGRGLRPSQLSFVDAMDGEEQRKEAIALSVKPFCKVVDLEDSTIVHELQTPLTLFNLNPKLKTPNKVRVFEQVYEPLEQVEKEKGISKSAFLSMDDIDAVVKREKASIVSMRTPDDIKDHTPFTWKKGGPDAYEIWYEKDKTRICVTKNLVDRYEVVVYNNESKQYGKRLNAMQSLAGAVKLADDFARKHLDVRFNYRKSKEKRGVSQRTADFIQKLYPKSFRLLKDTYPDTGVRKFSVYINKEVVVVEDMEIADSVIKNRTRK